MKVRRRLHAIRRCVRCYRAAGEYAGTAADGTRWCKKHGAVESVPGVIWRSW